jgi:hypothetical protein
MIHYNLASINIQGRSSPMPPSTHVKKNKSIILYEKINCLFLMVIITCKVCANLAPQVGDKAILTNGNLVTYFLLSSKAFYLFLTLMLRS